MSDGTSDDAARGLHETWGTVPGSPCPSVSDANYDFSASPCFCIHADFDADYNIQQETCPENMVVSHLDFDADYNCSPL